MSIYQEQGYDNRKAYLKGLAEEFGLPESEVFLAASILGPSEDFDGLITTLEDRAEQLDYEGLL